MLDEYLKIFGLDNNYSLDELEERYKKLLKEFDEKNIEDGLKVIFLEEQSQIREAYQTLLKHYYKQEKIGQMESGNKPSSQKPTGGSVNQNKKNNKNKVKRIFWIFFLSIWIIFSLYIWVAPIIENADTSDHRVMYSEDWNQGIAHWIWLIFSSIISLVYFFFIKKKNNEAIIYNNQKQETMKQNSLMPKKSVEIKEEVTIEKPIKKSRLIKTKLQARILAVIIFFVFLLIYLLITVNGGGEVNTIFGPIDLFITVLIYRMFLKPPQQEK